MSNLRRIRAPTGKRKHAALRANNKNSAKCLAGVPRGQGCLKFPQEIKEDQGVASVGSAVFPNFSLSPGTRGLLRGETYRAVFVGWNDETTTMGLR